MESGHYSQKVYKSFSSSDSNPVEILPIPTNDPLLNKEQNNEYSLSIPIINGELKKQKERLLEEHGFTYIEDAYNQFQAVIIQANKQMIVYQTTFGSYKTEISAFSLNIELRSVRQFVGTGKFGEVLSFQGSDNYMAAKCIKKPKGILYPSIKCLKQIYMVKFASALGVGPLYYKAYSYDILVLKDHCEFLMELCQQPILRGNKQKQSLKQKDLFEALAILHSFKVVHMDIKPQNIAYSPHYKKFVFLDFGFAKFIQAKPGEKTWIKPQGTYPYMNQDMKSAFVLNQIGSIDLYDNDLFGLKETLKLTHLQSHIVKLKSKVADEPLNNNPYEWSQYLDYFKASYNLRIENYVEFQKLVMAEKNLPFTLRRLVRQGDMTEKTKTRYVKYLNLMCSKKYMKKSYDQILRLKCADSQLYVQLSKAESENFEKYDKDIKNIQILYHRKQLQNLWMKREWIDQIFRLLFLKKKLKKDEIDLQNKLADFIYQQQQDRADQKYLKILQMFKQQYETQMNIEQIFKIRFLYESAGFLHQAQKVHYRIWQLALHCGSELFCILTLKYLFCQFIIQQLEGYQWFSIDYSYQWTIAHKKTPFNICIKVVDELKNISQSNKYCKPTKKTFDPLWKLFHELEYLVKGEKAQMVILKIKNLLLYLQYGLIDRCYVATNQHLQKQENEEIVKPDINDPIFSSKREFITMQKNQQYMLQTSPMDKLNKKIQNFSKFRIPFLSKVNSIWQFGQYVEAQKFKDTQNLLKHTILPSLKPINYSFFALVFWRHLIKSFKHSEECFRIFVGALSQSLSSQYNHRNLNDELIVINQFLLVVSPVWDALFYLNDQENKLRQLINFLFLISSKLKQRLLNVNENGLTQEDINVIIGLSEYIDAIADNLMHAIKGNSIRDTKAIQLLSSLSLTSVMRPCIDGCFSLFQNCPKFFSGDLDLTSQKHIVKVFNNRKCLQLSIVYMNYPFICQTVIQNFYRQHMFMELQHFEVQNSYQLKHTRYLKTWLNDYAGRIFCYGQKLPPCCIIQFCNHTLSVQRLQQVYNNSILIFIIYRCLNLVGKSLELKVQKRLVVIVSHGLPLFIGETMKREIKGYILKLQVLLNQEWSERKKLIGLKKQKIARKVSLIGYKKEAMKKMKKRLEEASNREKCRIEIISELLKGKLKKMKMTDDWK